MSNFRQARLIYATAAFVTALVVSSCTGGGGNGGSSKAPTADHPVTATMYAPRAADDPPDLSGNTYTKYVERAYHMKIKWNIVPSSDADTKQSLLLSSGDYPDVFLSADFSSSQIVQYASQGVFIPLNDLIKKYAPNVAAALAQTPQLAQADTTPDGKIYTLAGYGYCFHCKYPDKMWVDAKYLKQYSLKLPTTTDEFTHMLEVFKEHGLALEGDNGGDPTSSIIPFLMNAFTYSAGYGGANLFDVDSNGKLVFTANTEKWREGLRYIHGLYEKGLISQNVFTQSDDDLAREFSQHKVGAFAQLCANCLIPNFGAPGSDAKEWVTIPPLKGPDGTRYATYGVSASGGQFAITNKASKAAQIAVMKMVNGMYTTAGAIKKDYGPNPDEMWQPAKAGQVGLTGAPAKYDINWEAVDSTSANQPNVGWGQGLGPSYHSKDWFDSYVAPAPLSGANEERTLQLMTDMFYAGLAPDKVMTNAFWVKPQDAQQYSSDAGNLWSYIQQWTANFVIGKKSLDSDWSAYKKGLNGLGLDRYTRTSQAAMRAPLSTESDGPNNAASVSSLAMMPKSQEWEVALLKDAYQRERGKALAP